MAHGLQIHNDSGILQIDETYANLALVQKGTVSWGASLAGSTALTLPTVSSPFIAIGNCTAPVLVRSNNVVPNTTYGFFSATAGSCTYYLFDRVQTTNGETHGLAVYNSSGQLTYHSSWQVARIGNMVKVADGSLSSFGTTATLSPPYAGAWAAAASCLRFRNHMVSGSSHAFTWEAMYCDNSGAYLTVQQQAPIGGVLVNDQPTGGMLMLIDVTGY